MYVITAADEDKVLQLYFKSFILTGESDCNNEYVQIYNGDSTADNLLHISTGNSDGKFCGNVKPPVILSTGRSLTVRYFLQPPSDASTSFFADWIQIPKSQG